MNKPVGVIGAGSFGTAISNLLAINTDVLLFTRRKEVMESINERHEHLGIKLSPRIRATDHIQSVAEQCDVIFPVVPSESFRKTIVSIAPYLKPYHIVIHGTKGFDVVNINMEDIAKTKVSRSDVRTMSEVILEETVVKRVGCLSGPNLAKEIIAGQPTAGVIASKFDEVIKIGDKALDSNLFHVYGSHDLLGAELAGALKNIIAIGSGILGGMGMGRNLQAMLITRGLIEMVNFGKALGSESRAFLGTAGIGDLIATATSTSSRNYTFGERLAKGETMEQIKASSQEVAEGVRTLQIARQLAKNYKLHVPITQMLYSIVFEKYDIPKALDYLITYPYDVDVDFM
jgi:glycerol-3-phosphate dehydrogenase (NAD(P)+)